MSVTSSPIDHASPASSGRSCGERRGNWTPVNTVATVLGFVFFWPIGLFVLFWVLSGRDVRSLPGAVREQWHALRGHEGRGFSTATRTGNVAFDDFQRTQYDRIREIKHEIVARAQRFQAFRASAQRQRDDDEFARFMATAPDRRDDHA